MARPSRTDGGFTLLEVMAAVAILAIWLVMIVGTAMQGLRAEGMSHRRLEAALMADRYMAELEAQTVGGSVPEANREEIEEGIFTVVVSVGPFTLGGPQARAEAAGVDEDSPPQLSQLISQEIPGQARHLRRLDVRVVWREAGAEKTVSRTGFAFDLTKAAEAYEGSGVGEDGESDDESDGGDADQSGGGQDLATPTAGGSVR